MKATAVYGGKAQQESDPEARRPDCRGVNFLFPRHWSRGRYGRMKNGILLSASQAGGRIFYWRYLFAAEAVPAGGLMVVATQRKSDWQGQV
jgi:hypothetical protein